MIFTCEEDNSLNVMYRLSRWNDGPWELEHRDFRNIETLNQLLNIHFGLFFYFNLIIFDTILVNFYLCFI
jgi:hypothetical protein